MPSVRMLQYHRSHFVPLASVEHFMDWAATQPTMEFLWAFSSSTILWSTLKKYPCELFLKSDFSSTELQRVLYQPMYINHQPLKLYWEAISRDFAETNLEFYISFCSRAELSLSFWIGGLEMLSVFPHNVSRDGVLTCDILSGRKLHIQGHDYHLSVQNWLNTNSLPRSIPSKTPKSSAHDFLVVGLNTNAGSLFSRPAKLWLTSTI